MPEVCFASIKEIDEVLELWKKAGVYYEPEDKKEALEKLIGTDSSIIVAKENEKIIGSAVVITNPFQSFIYRLSVHPDYKRRGLGTMLLDFALIYIGEKGYSTVNLFVEENNEISMRLAEK